MPLDDLVCTSTNYDAGVASVQMMDGVYQAAPDAIKQQFQSAHDSIMTTFNANYSWYGDWIPFGAGCQLMGNLGAQADQLTSQIQIAMGQSPTPGKPSGGFDLSGLQGVLIPAVIGLVLIFVISRR